MSNVRPHRMRSVESNAPPFFLRLLGAVVGGVAGAVTYVVWGLFIARHESLSFAGTGKWFIAAGALLGILNGLRFALELWWNSWGFARDESTGFAIAAGLVIAAILLCFYVVQWLHPGL